jgi:hypothetical protein
LNWKFRKVNLNVEKIRNSTTMLLSSSKTKQTPGSRDSVPRKLLRSSKVQTARNKVVLSSSSSSIDSDDDVATVKTPPRREKPLSPNERLLKFGFQIPKDQLSHQNHVNILQFIALNLSASVTLLNKRNETLKTPAIMALQNSEVYQNHFDAHKEDTPDSYQVTVIQAVQMTMSVSTLKRVPGFMEILQSNNAYITPHEWLSDIWEVRTIGFLTQYSPNHYPKEATTKDLNALFKNNTAMPQYRLKCTVISSLINQTPVRVSVYAIEVQVRDIREAEKIMLKASQNPDYYISFRLKKMNPTAFRHAVAIVAQHQNDLRTIVINNVSEEAFFVLENKALQVEKIQTVHHLINKNSVCLVAYAEDILEVRKKIRLVLPDWIDELDPSDICSCGDKPVLVSTRDDNLSDESISELSQSIDSLLSLDIYELSLFQGPKAQRENPDKTESDVTMSNTEEKVKQQQEIIETQGRKIDELLAMFQEMKSNTEKNIDILLQLITNMKEHHPIHTQTSKQDILNPPKTSEKLRRPA